MGLTCRCDILHSTSQHLSRWSPEHCMRSLTREITQKIQNDNHVLDNRTHEKDRESWGLVWSNTIEHPAALTCWAHAHVFSWAVFSRSTMGRIRALRSTEGAGNVNRSAEPCIYLRWERVGTAVVLRKCASIYQKAKHTNHPHKQTHFLNITLRWIYDQTLVFI